MDTLLKVAIWVPRQPLSAEWWLHWRTDHVITGDSCFAPLRMGRVDRLVLALGEGGIW